MAVNSKIRRVLKRRRSERTSGLPSDAGSGGLWPSLQSRIAGSGHTVDRRRSDNVGQVLPADDGGIVRLALSGLIWILFFALAAVVVLAHR